ncbi:MAG: amino acid transporter, partial [Pseudomonadota bacterium]
MGITPLDLAAWDAWSPQYLAERLKGVRYHWYVVGGWALDLWHGEQTRPHEDLEFAVLPEDASAVAAELSELAFFENRKTGFTHCTFEQTPASDVWQYWGGDIEQGVWRVDMMIERGTPQTWCYKRNASLRQA